MIEINKDPSARELRQFGCIFLPVFCLVVGGLFFKRGMLTGAEAVWGVGALGFLVGAAAPMALKPLFVGWLYAAYPIGWVVSHVILAALYYLVMTPMGLLMKVVGRDPLALRRDPKATTYWVERRKAPDSERYLRQY